MGSLLLWAAVTVLIVNGAFPLPAANVVAAVLALIGFVLLVVGR